MILEPNRQRRRRVFRVAAALVAVVLAGAAVAAGWTVPALSNIIPTASPAPAVSPTAAVAVVPTPTPTLAPTAPLPTPQPTLTPEGCVPPPSDLVPAVVASHGLRTVKAIALTFDDGNNSGNVARIREFLIAHRVNATFFPTARAVELAPTTWLRVAQAAFPIANHTYHHQSLEKLCFEAQLTELEKAKSVFLEQSLPMQPYMRPPYEDFDLNTRLAANAAGEGYVVLWDVDTLDWTGIGSKAIASRALAAGRGSIILMHTSSPATAAALYQIVSHYRKWGYTFVTIGQLLGIPGPVPFP